MSGLVVPTLFKKIVRKQAFFVCLVWMMAPALYAVDTVVLVANSSHFSLLHRIETAIYSQPGPRPQVMRLEAGELVASNQFQIGCTDNCRLIVAVGLQATRAVVETKTTAPILSILIRKHAYEELREQFVEEFESSMKISAIYIDQPFGRQLALIESMMQNTDEVNSIGVLVGPNSIRSQQNLEKSVIRTNNILNVIRVNNRDYAIAALDVLLEDVNVILALPDSTIYNSRTARGLLLSAYRKQVPIVGFSRTYVNNGALAAVYSSPKQIAAQTAQVIKWIIQTDNLVLPPETYPDTFSVAVNYQVARSLGLDIESEAVLHYQVIQNESKKMACHQNETHKPLKG